MTEELTELLELERIPKIDECNLKLLQELYNELLSKKIFAYKLDNGAEIKIRFYSENFPHLLGIQKVVQDRGLKKFYQGKHGYDGILNGDITIENLEKIDSQQKKEDRQFKAIVSKITCFHLIPKLLENCEIIRFYPSRVRGGCNLKSEFILFDNQLGIKLHLGVLKSVDDSKIYVPESFIPKGPRERDRDRLTNTIPKQEFKKIVERAIFTIDE